MKSDRKLKRRVVFTSQKAYCVYQTVIIKWYMKKHDCSETEAMNFYVESGLAKAFEDHHRPNNKDGQIEVSEVGQKIV